MEQLNRHYQEALSLFPEDRIVGVFLQGSQNYGLDYEGSDIDTKCIVLPTLEDLIFNRKPVSTTHVLPNEEHLDLKDVRLYFQTFRKQNLNFMEILFTKYKIVNPTYEPMWNRLVENNEQIARYNPVGAVKTMKGIAMEKYHAMEHRYPSKVDLIDTQNELGCLLQLKLTQATPNYFKIREGCPIKDKPFCIIWNKTKPTESTYRSQGEIVMIPKDYFYELIKNYYGKM